MSKTVLVVDDSKMARSVIRRILEMNGWEKETILEAGNGREALELLKESPCDLVITDLNMPKMDGEQLLRRIKGSPRLNHIDIVVISSLINDSRQQKLFEAEALAIFAKPLSVPEFSNFLRNYRNTEEDDDEF